MKTPYYYPQVSPLLAAHPANAAQPGRPGQTQPASRRLPEITVCLTAGAKMPAVSFIYSPI